MKILFITSEIHPLVKTGGLADVARALPMALHHLGDDIRILLPGYRSVMPHLSNPIVVVDSFPYGLLPAEARLLSTTLPDSPLPLWVLDCPALFDRSGGPYQTDEGVDWADNPQRFAALSQVGAWLASAQNGLSWTPDIVHCNDWQSALTPALLKFQGNPTPSVLTIHNLAFQGNFAPEWVSLLNLPASEFHPESLEFYGQLSFLKAGLVHAHHITTVSPRYAREIQTPQLGCGLDGLLRHRRHSLSGILNGIDELWNPDTDACLPFAYSVTRLSGKKKTKEYLQKRLGLPIDPKCFMVGLVSRLTEQKGIDLLLDSLERLLEYPVQIVILGSGDAEMERRLAHWSSRTPQQLHVSLGFNEALSHQIIAASDLFLMPSRFEPCGLAQMYAMTYGTPPLVHRTGGLADTVVPCHITPTGVSGTGFVFEIAHMNDFKEAFYQAYDAFQDKKHWLQLQKNGMKQDFRWNKAATEYQDIYQSLLK
ncbi:MAG: glycogen synthase GlgA [Ferrovum sp.]|nr:glycogen synthase GlgA [Ferrovum sp.]NDU87043.1 glycogen synthase GlgA [Ferrovum sp.]